MVLRCGAGVWSLGLDRHFRGNWKKGGVGFVLVFFGRHPRHMRGVDVAGVSCTDSVVAMGAGSICWPVLVDALESRSRQSSAAWCGRIRCPFSTLDSCGAGRGPVRIFV